MFSCFEYLFLFTLETTIRENSVNCFKVYVSKLESRNLKHRSSLLFQPLLHDVFIINPSHCLRLKLTSACFDRQYSNNCKLSGSILWCLFPIQSVALYILGDESAVSNEASHYLYKITSGKDALMPSQYLLVSCVCYMLSFLLGEHGSNMALSFLGQRKQQIEQDDSRYAF